MGFLKKFAAVVLISAVVFQLCVQEPESTPFRHYTEQKLIRNIDYTLRPNGSLLHVGWMATHQKVLNENAISPYNKLLRYKKWNYYDVFTDDFIVQMAIADLAYTGNCFFTIVNKKDKSVYHYEELIMPWNMPALTPTSFRYTNGTKDDINYQSSKIHFEVYDAPENAKMDGKFYIKTIKVNVPSDNMGISFTVNVSRTQELIGMVTPMNDEMSQFYLNYKACNHHISGTLNYKNQIIQLTPKNSLGGQDWGRGVWPYHTYWVWARAQGRLEDNSRFALNLGNGFTDFNRQKATEDAYFVNNFIYKLNAAEVFFDKNNLMNPWQFKCTIVNKNFKECDITFTPEISKNKHTNLLVIKSSLDVVFGKFSGWVSNSKGNKIHFEGIDGLAEVHKARW